MTAPEQAAIVDDARRQIRHLRRIRARLLPDAGRDHAVLLEPAWLNGQIRQAEGEIGIHRSRS